MVLSLSYRRPSYVSLSSTQSTLASSSSAWSALKNSDGSAAQTPNGVPIGLSFDRILAGKTQKPCSLRDFMDYLVYVERSAENLQFFLWYRDYMLRFANLPASEKALSPLWMNDQVDNELSPPSDKLDKIAEAGIEMAPTEHQVPRGALPNFDMTLETDADAEKAKETDITAAPLQWDGTSSKGTSTRRGDFRQVAANAFESHGLVVPFTIQPYREEVTRIIATYIAEGSPRELPISPNERHNLLAALATTTHPSAFGRVAAIVETSLRHGSHPNFVRHCIQNGHDPRITFAVSLGAVTLSLGLVFALITTLSSLRRGWRAFSAIFFMIGIATLILAIRGMCVVLNVFHHCHLQPWELFEEEPDDTSLYDGESGKRQKGNSFDSFGSSNSWEDQPWVSKYERMSVFRKIFSREQYVNDSALRQIQFTMLLQSLIGALMGTIVLEAIFLSVPAGNFF